MGQDKIEWTWVLPTMEVLASIPTYPQAGPDDRDLLLAILDFIETQLVALRNSRRENESRPDEKQP
jgi:hypothetical protein